MSNKRKRTLDAISRIDDDIIDKNTERRIKLFGVAFRRRSNKPFVALVAAIVMYPVIVTLCMVIFFGEKRSLIDYLAIAASIFGVYLLASGDSIMVEGGNTRLGLACSLISAFSFAAYYIVMKQVKADKIEVVKFTTWIMMLSAVYFIIGAFVCNGKLTVVTDAGSWLNILGLGLWSTMVSNITGVKGNRRIGPTMTSILVIHLYHQKKEK